MHSQPRRDNQCQGDTYDGLHSWPCEQNAKPGETLCGRHLAGKRRSAQARERWKREADAAAEAHRIRKIREGHEASVREATARVIDEVRLYATAKHEGHLHGDNAMLLAMDRLEHVLRHAP